MRGGRDPFDVVRFVLKLIRDFEEEHNLRLEPDAAHAVLQPAIDNRDHIADEFRLGNVTREVIYDAVYTLLRNASGIARGKGGSFVRSIDRIDRSDVEEAMKRECRYFPWC